MSSKKVTSIFPISPSNNIFEIFGENLTTLYVKLLLSPSLWLTHAQHGPWPLQCALRAFRNPQQLLSSADTQPASTTGHRQEWLSVSTAANPAGHCGFLAGITTISTSPKTYGNVCMGMRGVCVWKGRSRGEILSLLMLYSLLKSTKAILCRYQKRCPFHSVFRIHPLHKARLEWKTNLSNRHHGKLRIS